MKPLDDNLLNEHANSLADFAANLRIDSIPENVIRRAEDLFVDWVGSTVAGFGFGPVQTIRDFAQQMGPSDGLCELLGDSRQTSALFSSLVNAASSHAVEQDDVHNGSVFHPATVVFPATLAVAQQLRLSGRDFLVASIVGYEVGIRVGEFLGRSHYKVFHTTGTAGTIASAAGVGRLLSLGSSQMTHAFGTAGTQAAGLWAFLKDAADSKQVHTAHASMAGLMSAFFARGGLTGARNIFYGSQGMASGMSTDSSPEKLSDGLNKRWTVLETSFKFHACCRHCHPAIDALLAILRQHSIHQDEISSVTAHVHQGAIDVLGNVVEPMTVHQAKFSMGTSLGLAAFYGVAGLIEFEKFYREEKVIEFCKKVSMQFDPEIDEAYPKRWIGKITVTLRNGNKLNGRVDQPKGDPDNTLTRDEINDKFVRLTDFSNRIERSTAAAVLDELWRIRSKNEVGRIIPESIY